MAAVRGTAAHPSRTGRGRPCASCRWCTRAEVRASAGRGSPREQAIFSTFWSAQEDLKDSSLDSLAQSYTAMDCAKLQRCAPAQFQTPLNCKLQFEPDEKRRCAVWYSLAQFGSSGSKPLRTAICSLLQSTTVLHSLLQFAPVRRSPFLFGAVCSSLAQSGAV